MSSPDQASGDIPERDREHKIPLVVIVGPTAVGKTEIAIQLAESLGGEIVSADSRLFYRGMDIGTAKPTLEERKRVRHFLIDVVDPDETWSLALFQHEANNIIRKIYEDKYLPFLVGGTGQFIRAVVEGWKIPPVKPDPRLRLVLTQWAELIGPKELHAKLAILDPQAAATIDYTNVRRTSRALEVIFTTGKRFSELKVRGFTLYDSLLIGLSRPRAELYHRIDERISRMLEMGLIDEVRNLLDNGFSPELPTMSAIGYGEIIAYLQGKITSEEAVSLIKRRTREFVRRQANWFKLNDQNIHWFTVDQTTETEIAKLIKEWISNHNYATPPKSPAIFLDCSDFC